MTAIQRTGTPLAVGVITAGALTRNYQVAIRNRSGGGYQRPLSTARVNKLVEDLKGNRVDLPTAVLLNLRDYESEAHLIEDDGRLYFAPNGTALFVVDGQHRIAALAKLVEREAERWENYEIPFACMLGAAEDEEIEQFFVVNSTAKSVRTDLAYVLLRPRAEADPEVMKGVIESAQDWKVEGQRIAEALSAECDMWHGRIRFPGDAKGATTVNNAGVVNSIKPLLGTPYFGALDHGNQVKILSAYWRGIHLVLPDVFGDATEFTLQKMTGVTVLHNVLTPVIEYIRSTGGSLLDPEAYADVLREPLTQLQETNRHGHPVSGADFWRQGADGAAGMFSSNAGRRVLTARLRQALPKPDVS